MWWHAVMHGRGSSESRCTFTGVLISAWPDQEGNKLHSPHFMELGGSLPHSQESTTCPYPSQINPFLCPSHFWQAQLVSFLVGLRTYQHPGIKGVGSDVHSIRQFPFHFPSPASPCAITIQLDYTVAYVHSDFPNAVYNEVQIKVLRLCYVTSTSTHLPTFRSSLWTASTWSWRHYDTSKHRQIFTSPNAIISTLTLSVLMWRIGWAHNNARK